MTLRDLEQLKHRSKCSKTTLPESYVPMTKYSDKTANGLTTAIVDFYPVDRRLCRPDQ